MKRTEKTFIGHRLVALLLFCAMAMSVLPTVAFSDGTGGTGETDEYVQEGVYDWDYGSETEHTVYYARDQYPNGYTVSDDNVDYFASHCTVAMTYYNDNDHLWEGSWVQKTSCTEKGIYDEECLFCHAHRVTYHKPTGHQRYKMLSSTEPTCTQEGEDIYKCQWCDAKIRYSTPAKGHYWVLDEYTSKEATVWEAGHNDYKCARENCNETKTEVIPALGGYKLPKIREQELFGQNTYDQYFRTWHGVKYSDIWGIDHYDECKTWSSTDEYEYLDANKYVDVYEGSTFYYNDQIVIKGAQISLNESKKSVAVLYAQDDSTSGFGTTWVDIVVDTSETEIPIEVYLVDFGITKDNGKKTKGIASLTVKGNGADVYFVNSNIGFIDYKEIGSSDYSDTYVMRGNYVNGDTAYIALDGYDSHVYMGPDVNLADPKDAHVKVSVHSRMPSKAKGDRTTLWYNPVNPDEKYWFMMEGIYGTSFMASFEYVPTVELCNLTIEELGIPKSGTVQVRMRDPETGAFIDPAVSEEMSYAEAILYDMTAPYTIHNFSNASTSSAGGLLQNGVFDQLSGAALYNCDWHVGTIEVNDFSWVSLSNSELAKFRCSDCGYETSKLRDKCPWCSHEGTLESTSSKVNLHNRARLTIGGEQTCDITTYGTNRIYLDDARLTGSITAAGHSDDAYNSMQMQPNIAYNFEREDLLQVPDDNKDYVPDVDPSKDIYHGYVSQKGSNSTADIMYVFTGSDLALYLSGNSTITSLMDTGFNSDYYPAIMVDREAILKIDDDSGKDGIGVLSIEMSRWYSRTAAIGGVPSTDPRPHGWIIVNGGIINAKGGNGAAGIGGSNHDPSYDSGTYLGKNVTPTQEQENQYDRITVDPDGSVYGYILLPGLMRNGGHISVNGGVVNAEGYDGGAAVGGAIYGSGARIEIGGGTLNAKSTTDGYVPSGAAIGGGAARYRSEKKRVGYQMVRLKNADGGLSPVYVYIDENGTKRYTYEKTTNPQFATFTDSDGTVHTAVKNAEYEEFPGVTFELDEKYAIYAGMYEYESGGFGGNISISGGSVVTAWADNPSYVKGSGYSGSPEPVDRGTEFYHALAANQSEPEKYTNPNELWLYDQAYGESRNYHDFYYSEREQDEDGYYITLGKFFRLETDGSTNRIAEHPLSDLYDRDADSYYNGKTAGYVIGATCYEAAHTYNNRISMGSGKGYNPLIIIGQNKSVGGSSETIAADDDHYYVPDTGVISWYDPSAETEDCNGTWIASGISHLAGIILVGYDTAEGDYVLNSKLGKYAYRVHGQIDLPDLGSPQTLELKEGTVLTLANGSVMNVPDRFEIIQETDGQLVLEEGCVVQGKGMWPGKPADPANPPTTEQVRSILERMKTENPEEQVATHLAVVQTADGEQTVIDGTSADDIRRKMKAVLLTEQSLLTMISSGSYGFRKEGNVWKLKSYDPKMVVSLTENGALSASPGKHIDNTKRFDVLVTDYNNHVNVKLQSARLSTPEYKIYDGQADDEITLQLEEAGSEFSFAVELNKDQVNNNKCVFNVPKFAGSEFSLSTIKVLRSKCALRYSGTMTFTTPVMDVAGIDISELQINYSNGGSKLGGINGSGHVQIPDIAGFPVGGGAEMTLNTFAPNRELSLSVELETPIFEGAFEASFKETRGIIMIDTLYAEVAAGEGGIPLVPPTVIGYLQGGGLGFTGLADTIAMDSFGAPPVRLKIAAKGSILDVIEGWARLSIGPSGFDLELTDIEIADADFIKEYGISASWDAQEKEIDHKVYWGVGADMSQYIVIGIPIKSYGGYDNSENGVIGGISATGTVEFGGFAGYRSEGEYLYFVYQLHASGSINGSVSIPKNLIAGFPFKSIELASIDMGFYAEANATTKVNKSAVKGSAASVLRQLASGADLDINAVIGAKVTAGVGPAKCFVRLVYVLGEKGIDFSAGLGTGEPLDLSDYTANGGNSYSVLGTAEIEGSENRVPTIYQASVKTEAVLAKKGTRGAADTVELKLLDDKTVTAKVNSALANNSIVKLTLADSSKLSGSQIIITDGNGDPVRLISEQYDDDGLPTVDDANFFTDDGMICFVPPAAGTYTIAISGTVNAAFADGEIIVTEAFATLDTANTGLVGEGNLKYQVNDASANTLYKVQMLLGTEQGKGDYVLAETGELTADDLSHARNLAFTLTGTAAPGGTYYPGYLLLEYVEAQDASGRTYGTWAAVDQIYTDSTVAYVNDQEVSAPANVSLSYSGNGSMTASWTAVADADAYQLAVYEQTDSGLSDTGIRFVTEDASATSFVMDLSSLTAGKEYCVGVSAITYQREEAGEGNLVISPDGKYQDGREGLSAPVVMPQAAKPEIRYSDNVRTGEGNQHTMFVSTGGSAFRVTSATSLTLTVREKESGTPLSVIEEEPGIWSALVPSQSLTAGSGSDAPFILEVVARDADSGDYVLDYITVTPDSIAPPLSIDNMGNFPKWQIESGFYATIKGQSEAGAKIYVYKYNSTNSEFEVVSAVYASDDGRFAVPVQFNGKPLFCIRAEDAAGNKTDPVSIGFPDPDISINLNLGPGTSSVAGISLMSGSQIGTLPTPVPCTEEGVERSFKGWYLHVAKIDGITTTVTNIKGADGEDVYVNGQPLTAVTQTGTGSVEFTDILVDPGMVFRKDEDGRVTVSKLVQGTGADAGKLVEETVTTFDGNPVLYAGWDESVSVTFSQGTGASCAIDTLLLAKGTAVGALPIPVRTDGASKAFDGWFNESGAKVTAAYTVNKDETLTARWIDVVKVTFDPGIGGIGLTGLTLSETEAEQFAETGALVIEAGSAIPVYPTASATGYAFQGWYCTDGAGNAVPVDASTVYSADTTLTAQWIRNVSPLFVTQESYEATGAEDEILPDPAFTKPDNTSGLPSVTYAGTGSTNYLSSAKPTKAGTYKVTVQCNTPESAFIGSAEFTVRDGNATRYDVTLNPATNGSVSANPASAAAGETVTLTLTPDAGYKTGTITVLSGQQSIDVSALSGGACTFVMPASGVEVTATFEALAEPAVDRVQAVLTGEISMRFYTVFPDGFDGTGAYMDFALSDGRTDRMDYADAPDDGTGGKIFTCYMNAMELSETITATFRYGTGQTVVTTYSASDYLSYLSAHADRLAGTREKQEQLFKVVNALLNYGYYLQQSGWTDGMANHAPVEATDTGAATRMEAVKQEVEAKKAVKSMGTSGIPEQNVFFSLTLNADTVVNLYILKSDAYTVDSAMLDGNAYVLEEVNIGGADYIRIHTDPIGASGLMDDHTVVLTTASGEAAITFSATSYVRSVLNGSLPESNKLAMVAFYDYAVAAKAYW